MSDKEKMRILGLDVGSHTIGVAVSDQLAVFAQGLKTIKRKSMETDLHEISAIISELEIEKIIVGLPKNLDGSLGPQAEVSLQWIRALRRRFRLPVVGWDERLSTIGASRALFEADVSRKKRKAVIDKMAAVFILQGYLDKKRKGKDGSVLRP